MDTGDAVAIRVCDGLACELAGARELLARLPDSVPDGVRVRATACIGCCEQAPAVVVGTQRLGRATHASVVAQAGAAPSPRLPEGVIEHAAYVAQDGYRLLRRCIAGEIDADTVLQAIDDSGLHGIDGAAAAEWRRVHNEPAPRLLAMGLGDGAPGSFVDRVLVARDPHRCLEGALIAAWAVGASRIRVDARADDDACHSILADALRTLQQHPPYPGVPSIELRRDALAASGGPTLRQRAHTLHWVRAILELGAHWFASQGRRGRIGLRSFSVSGRVKTPGVKLAPAGITVRELIDEHCGGMLDGHRLYAYLPGGTAGGILPSSMAHLPLDADAGIVVLSDHDRAHAAVRHFPQELQTEGVDMRPQAHYRSRTPEGALTLLEAARRRVP